MEGLLGLWPVRVARFVLLAVLAGGIAGSVPSLGLSRSTPGLDLTPQACGREEFVSGLEAVFGRSKTHQAALTLRNKVVGRGFANANIIEGCDGFRVVVRGIETFDIGVGLQTEARKEGFPVTLECIKAKQIGRWDGVLGHGRDRASANTIVARAASVGFPGAKLTNDPCGGFEVSVTGFPDQGSALSWAEAARSRGFPQAIAELN
jgi:hypothetical protein